MANVYKNKKERRRVVKKSSKRRQGDPKIGERKLRYYAKNKKENLLRKE